MIKDLHESDDLRILDDGERAFRLFRLAEFGCPILHEPVQAALGGASWRLPEIRASPAEKIDGGFAPAPVVKQQRFKG